MPAMFSMNVFCSAGKPSVDTQEKNDGENGNDEVTIKAADNGTLLDFKSLNSCFENK